MKKLPLNIQFFAEEENKEKDDVMTPENVLIKLMGSLPIEDWVEEFDVLQKAIAENTTAIDTDANYEELKKENERLSKNYNKLTEAYKKRFGELTEEKIQNTLGRNEEAELDYRELNMAAGFFAGTE